MGLEIRSDASPTDASWLALSPGVGATTATSARQAEQLSAISACVGAISSALAYVPAYVYRRQSDGTRLEVTNHPLRSLFAGGVNSRMTWPEFFEHLVASTLLTGNGLAQIERAANGRVTGLRWIPWQQVTVSQLRSGRLAYDVNDGLRTRRLLEGEVLHLRERTDDGIVGKSRIARAGETVAGVRAADEWARSFLANGAAPSGALQSDSKIDPANVASLRSQLAEKFMGARNAGRPIILESGMKWQSISMSPEDSELLETRKFGVIEICRLYQVPPPIIQAYENNTFTNAAQAGLWFATFCLAPWARRIESEFARTVFAAGSNLELELDLSGFLRGDPETRWNAHKIAIEAGVLDADEVRQIEGWNPRAAA
ncbi:phage portal protein [Erythrobacter sp. QSSC1-22B]|uniref:phage portal protein n=1 Tax=Erythrobacter sp. QSSC1-22B TaxID=1860125 RepID=UPI002100BBDA|nr:phage portal protein [Erythrobacter sp. QSSC1-22B]